jgi:hypothetical protein
VASLISVTMHPDVVEVVRGAIADIDKAHNVATAAVDAAPDPVTAFAVANELAAHMQVLAASDNKLKDQLSGRIWDARKMSLAGMADQVGISTRRADQPATDARRTKIRLHDHSLHPPPRLGIAREPVQQQSTPTVPPRSHQIQPHQAS